MVAEELRSLKKPVMAVPTDVSDEGQVNELIKKDPGNVRHRRHIGE